MSEEEKLRHKENVRKYHKEHPEVARKAALKQYYKDIAKAAIKAKIWRENNKEYVKVKQREDKRKRKEWAIEYLGGKCNKCSGLFIQPVYEFHHLNPSEKDRDPSKMLSLSMTKLKQELDKCILLCANCHRILHHEENFSGKELL